MVPKSTKMDQISSQNHSKSHLGVALGTPWAPLGPILGTPWGQKAKKHEKVTSWTPPGVPIVAMWEHFWSLLEDLFGVYVLASIFSSFGEPSGLEKVVFSMQPS